MHKIRKFLYPLILVFIVSVIFAGCSSNNGDNESASSEGEDITLSFANWVSSEDATKEQINDVISQFEEENPNITIDIQPIPFDDMRQQLLTQASGDNLPDVLMLQGPWSQELGGNGALEDLSEYASDEYLDDNYEEALKAGSYNDELYAVPFEMISNGLWYNKELMEEAGLDPNDPPQTLDELNSQMDQIDENLGDDVYPIGIDTTKIDYALVGFWPWLFSHGAEPLYDDEVNFDTPETTEALTWLRELVEKDYTPVGEQIKVERELMAKDKIVFKLDGAQFKGTLQNLNEDLEDDNIYDKFGITTVPVGENSESETIADIHQLGISKGSEYKEAAWKFVEYLASNDTSITDFQVPYGALPPLKSHNEEYEDLLDDPISDTFMNDVIPSMKAGPYSPEFGKEKEVIIKAMQDTVYEEDQSISDIVEKSEKELEEIQ